MAGNSLGELFKVTTFGESHGPAYGCIIDGCPPRLALSAEDIQHDLNRRKPGQSKYTTQRRESDTVEILSGVFEGQTTGTPIGLLVRNEDQRSSDYAEIKELFRPGHGDFTYQKKYGIRDHRGGGRASARETMMRVAAAAIARKYLKEHFNLEIKGYLAQLGPVKIAEVDFNVIDDNPFFCPDLNAATKMAEFIDQIRKEGDSIGAKIIVEAHGVPVGLGEPVFDRLDADIAKALMSINAVKGVEIGDGFDVVTQRGSAHRDEMTQAGFQSNHAGGILAGISTGQIIRASIALKPTSSIISPAQTLNTAGDECSVVTKGRHDPCVGIRAVPIAEAMLALVLMDHVLRHRGQCG